MMTATETMRPPRRTIARVTAKPRMIIATIQKAASQPSFLCRARDSKTFSVFWVT
ncbi:hypothetical protein D3C83_293670 [compost metagenome]